MGVALVCVLTPAQLFAQATSTTSESLDLEDMDELLEMDPPEKKKPKSSDEEMVDEIVVTGSRTRKKLKDVTVSTELINKKEMRESGAENLTEVLEEHPGVELERSTRGVGIRLMGLNPEHTLILVDGLRVTGRLGGSIDPTRFNLENLEQIEIVKGAGSAIYGSEAIGGVVNVITAMPKKPFESTARAVFGMFNTLDATGAVGAVWKDLSTRFSGGYHRSDGYCITKYENDPATGERRVKIITDSTGRPINRSVPACGVESSSEDIRNVGAGFESYNIVNTSQWEPSKRFKVRSRFDYRLLDQSADDIGAGNALIERNQRTEVISASLNPTITFAGGGQLRLAAGYERFRLQIAQDAVGGTQQDDFQDIRQEVGQVNLQVDQLLGQSHLFSLGLEGLFEAQSGDLINGSRNRQRAAMFVQDEWTMTEDPFLFQLVPSMRLDIDSQFGSAVTPRVAMRFDPIKQVIMRVSYGLGFRAPTFEELNLSFLNPGSGYFVEGNLDLVPERSQAFNFSGEIQPWKWLTASATFFYINLDNLIDTQRGDQPVMGLSRFRYVNVESARSTGVETTLTVRPYLKGLTVDLGYVYNPTRDRNLDRQLQGRATHKGTARAIYRNKAWGLAAMVRSSFFGERPFFADFAGDGVEDVAPPYVTLDMRVEKRFFDQKFSVFVGAENLFNAGDPDLLPITPRSVYGGISGRYDFDPSQDSPALGLWPSGPGGFTSPTGVAIQ